MTDAAPTVHVVDDDPDYGNSIGLLLSREGLSACIHKSAEDFLAALHPGRSGPRCLVVDLHMRGMTGLALLDRLAADRIRIPTIVVTGYSDVPTAVAAMRAGAVDFLQKPFHPPALLRRVYQLLEYDSRLGNAEPRPAQFDQRLAGLSDREREVLQLLVAGDNSKQVAAKLSISPKTAMKHRARVLEKLQVDSVVQLVLLMQSTGSDGP